MTATQLPTSLLCLLSEEKNPIVSYYGKEEILYYDFLTPLPSL
jgi:hypothetical protein